MHRVIVTFGAENPGAEIQRIEEALAGCRYSIVSRFTYTPQVVMEVDNSALHRLHSLYGITVAIDAPVPPLGD